MNNRTARRLAEAAALAVPAVVALSAQGHAAPILATPRANSVVGGRTVTFYAPFRTERPVASAKVFLDGKLLAKQTYSPAGVNGLVNVTWDSTSVSSGKYTVSLRLYDASGNIVSQERVPIKVDNGAGTDTIPPQIAIITPAVGEEMRGSFDIKVLASDNSGESPYVSVFVDKQLRGVSNHQPYSWAINTAEYDNGEHLLEAWAYDASQNKGTAEAVRVRFNNPGGATTFNPDVNRMGQAQAEAEPATATEAALPVIPAAQPAPTTETAPAPVPVVHIPPVRTISSAPEQPSVETPEAAATESAVAADAALSVPSVPSERMSDAPEAAPQHESIAAEPAGIRELPVTSDTTIQELPDTSHAGIQEIPVTDETGIRELPATSEPQAPAHAEASSPAEPPAAVEPRRVAPAETRTAKATPVKVARRPVESSRERGADSAQRAPERPVGGERNTRVVEPAAPEPLVLRMKGDQVLPNPPAPKRTMVAKAETAPKPAAVLHTQTAVKATAPEPTRAPERAASPHVQAKPPVLTKPVPEAENPAPRPQHLASAPRPTAAVVRTPKSTATVARAPKRVRAAAAPKPVAHVKAKTAPHPAIIPELPADTVRNGRIQHAVRPGESTREIARNYGVPVKELIASNNIGRRSQPRIGQMLEVPTPVRIALNNAPIQFDVAPRVQNGMTLAALRQVYEQAGGTVSWNAARREVRARGAGANIVVRIGSSEALVNGRKVSLDAPAYIEDGRTFLPVRFMVAALDLSAEYDLRSGSIYLSAAKHEPTLA